jgi:hypothetical protein
MSKKIIGILRGEVTDDARRAFEAKFPGCELEFRRLDSRDYVEHAQTCRDTTFAAVLLPLERPIPSVAMEEGTPHVALIPGMMLKELLPLEPRFRDFEPSD